jgi:ABC-type dipeptide/oligopeptide/nickel transport system permease subunit
VSLRRFTVFDGILLALGLVFFGLGVVAVIATVSIIVNWSEPAVGFPAGPGFIRFAKGFGLAFFPITALVTFATGWWLAGEHIKRALRAARED